MFLRKALAEQILLLKRKAPSEISFEMLHSTGGEKSLHPAKSPRKVTVMEVFIQMSPSISLKLNSLTTFSQHICRERE